jgi:hypothetical protein
MRWTKLQELKTHNTKWNKNEFNHVLFYFIGWIVINGIELLKNTDPFIIQHVKNKVKIIKNPTDTKLAFWSYKN